MTRPANRLIEETSPYLLQHAHNPVDWYPWGSEALARAKEEDRPIFLSIGYAACHWCHVMERESFEDDATAALMNERFVNIKVDREERPDLDDIYMKFVLAMTGSGGWPMSVWLTPEGQPIFGGTYFPPDNRYGRAAFSQVLDWVDRMWKGSRDRLLADAATMQREISARETVDTTGALDADVLDRALEGSAQRFDAEWGGFGSAPKFPHAMDLRLCLRHHLRTGDTRALNMATTSLDKMASGGIYDHLGGGFARYSTDDRWLIPHFEKMLYDNALLVPAFLDAYLVTGAPRYAEVARESCDFVLRELSTPEGGIGSTLDADSEGEEGTFYVWTVTELREVLGEELAREAAVWFDVREGGNFEHGKSALWRPLPAAECAQQLGVDVSGLTVRMASARQKLFSARAARPRPGYDDKVLVSWNGLMISALAQATQVLGDPRYLDAARAAARYILTQMRTPEGRLLATARAGRAHQNAALDDHVFLIAGLLDLYETDFDVRWFEEAIALDEIVREHFEDEAVGGWFTTSDDHETLILRLKSLYDGALPAGSGVHAQSLQRLFGLTGDHAFDARSNRAIESLAGRVNKNPNGFSQLLLAVDNRAAGMLEIVIAGDPGSEASRSMLKEVRGTYRPQRVVAHTGGDAEQIPLLRDRGHEPGAASAYLCRNFTCLAPISSPAALRRALSEGP